MNRMLINATHKDEELRIALASGQFLYDLIIETTFKEQKQSNIYKGIVTRIEPSLEAAFVDYSEGRHGFLPLKEVSDSCYKKSYTDTGRRPTISEVLEEGQKIIVQVEKEERGNKGAALTTYITLPGCYLVLMPNNPKAGGVSRRIEGEERDELHHVLDSLQVPEGMGLIIRTAGGGRSVEELQWDLEILLRLWDVIQKAASESDQEGGSGEGTFAQRTAPFLIYQEGNAVIRALRDYLRKDIDEILIDHPDVYEEVVNHLKLIRPDFVNRVKLYKDPTPLFTRFQIESQIESAFHREVRLPSGGSIIIDPTEALVSIDINSAKSTKGGDIEETALMTNLEAANEIARQLRLRDIGGLIVIDFIDMTPPRHQREVEECLKKALAMDRARVQIGRVSRFFGLLEMSRQRLRPSLGESSRVTCPRCSGQGTIRGIESLGLSVIRIIEEEALKENTAQVRAILPTEIAAYIYNKKRQAIIDIEKRQSVSVIILPSEHLITPQYEVERIRLSDVSEKDDRLLGYKITKPEISSQIPVSAPPRVAQEPAIKHIHMEEIPAPKAQAPEEHGLRETPKTPSLFGKILKIFKKKETAPAATKLEEKPFRRHHPKSRHHQQRGKGGARHHHRGRRDFRGGRGGSSSSSGGHRHYDQRDNRGERSDHRDRDHREQQTSHDHQRDRNDPPTSNTNMHTETSSFNVETREKKYDDNRVIPISSSSSSTTKNDFVTSSEQKRNESHDESRNKQSSTSTESANTTHSVQESHTHAPSKENKNERKLRRFHPRHRRRMMKHDHGNQHTQELEGEDIYKKRNEPDEQ